MDLSKDSAGGMEGDGHRKEHIVESTESESWRWRQKGGGRVRSKDGSTSMTREAVWTVTLGTK